MGLLDTLEKYRQKGQNFNENLAGNFDKAVKGYFNYFTPFGQTVNAVKNIFGSSKDTSSSGQNSSYTPQQNSVAQTTQDFNKSLDERLNAIVERSQSNADANQKRIESSADKALERYQKSIEAQNKWTAMREDTSVKRFMTQLKEAGLNPKLAYSMYNFSTSPSASSGFSSHQTATATMPSAQDYSNPVSAMVQLMVAEIQKDSNLSSTEMQSVTKALTTFLPLLLSMA